MARAGQRKASALAEEAFADYVAMGADRSLAALCARYQNETNPVPTRRIGTLKNWSTTYNWQARIASAVTEAAERKLQEAAELDADTFLRTSQELNKRAEYADALQMDQMIRMRETVRKPTPKGGTAVNVKVSVEVRQLAEQMAQQLGMDADELIREAELIAAGEWERSGSES